MGPKQKMGPQMGPKMGPKQKWDMPNLGMGHAQPGMGHAQPGMGPDLTTDAPIRMLARALQILNEISVTCM